MNFFLDATLLLLCFGLLLSLLSIKVILFLVRKRSIAMDRPGRRKIHEAPVPRIGGVGLFLGVIPVIFFTGGDERITSILLGALIVFFTGLIDDIKGVRWYTKMAGSLLASSVVVFYGGVTVESIGNIVGLGPVALGPLSIPFTFFCVIGVVNAINMIDGMNGLASGISVIIVTCLGFFAWMSDEAIFLYLCAAVAGGLTGVIFYNYPKGKVFLGDSGSNVIGFLMATIAIAVFGDGKGYSPMIPVTILFVPILDTLRVMFNRVLAGKNPFYPDKTHFHHILLRCGVKKDNIVPVIWLITLVLALSAILLKDLKGWQILIMLANLALVFGLFLSLIVKSNGFKRKKKTALRQVRLYKHAAVSECRPAEEERKEIAF